MPQPRAVLFVDVREVRAQQHPAGVVQEQDALGAHVAVAGLLRWDRYGAAAKDADGPL
ncbi:hypothetical protein [Mycobacterium sp. Aquia_213]|uniref:hypothetical protein n=1 Tax=Mycobacterium sp. Aquia_213 TaxID=2991728 RepID=UPI00226EB16B|nr:hypothetical protein [Mycobacterium sp. Aquia_213]WAC92233.1 hypothetical protein LMQ14_03220 [Mycobacterium sp. Aquia_213]